MTALKVNLYQEVHLAYFGKITKLNVMEMFSHQNIHIINSTTVFKIKSGRIMDNSGELLKPVQIVV